MDAVQSLYFGPRGPYGTEREAFDSWRQRATDSGEHTPDNLASLLAATAAAGVELGSYDKRILAWLAGWEPQVVEVIAALIERAADTKATVGK